MPFQLVSLVSFLQGSSARITSGCYAYPAFTWVLYQATVKTDIQSPRTHVMLDVVAFYSKMGGRDWRLLEAHGPAEQETLSQTRWKVGTDT